VRRRPVGSSNLRSVGYDSESRILEVEFHQGGIYQYFGVPAHVYSSLMRAASHGSYLHSHVKDIYPYARVS
jgi:hypothetical protein